MTFVSVIIPTYNRADIVKKTIDSFLHQSNLHFELIIVDDGSTDHTKEVVESYGSDRIKYFHINNSERGAARNFGASKAIGRFLNFFDSDDIALPNHIELAIQTMEKNPQMEAFQFHVAENNGTIKEIHCPNEEKVNKLILTGRYCFTNGVFIKKEVFLKYRYNESRSLSGTEDWDLYLRMVGEVDFWFFPQVTSHLIQHDGRSVLQFNEKALVSRYETLIQSISSSESFMNKNAAYLKVIKSRMLSYIALHAVLEKHKKVSIKYFRKAIKTRFSEIFTRRTLAIIKRLIF